MMIGFMPSPAECRIVFDGRMYNHSGIGSYIRNLTGQYAKQGITKDILLLTTGKVSGLDLKAKRCSCKIYGLAEQIFLPYLVKKACLLHTPHYNAPLLFPGKLVVTIHDLNHLTFYDQLPSVFHKLYAKTMMAMVVKKADAILAVSDWTRNDLCRRWPAAAAKIKTVYNGVPAPRNSVNDNEVTVKYQVDRPYILYLGLLKRHKNISRLLEAFSKAQRTLKGKYLLVIAGDPKSDEIGLPELVAQSPHRELIRLPGYITWNDLPALYGQAALFAFPSTAEGFGLPPLEAMSYGIPVISSNATCLPEILKDAPRYFNPYDINDIAACIERSLIDSKWRDGAGRKGRKISAGYRWENTARTCLEIYNSLL